MGVLCLQDGINEENLEFAALKLEIREELHLEVKDGEFSSCIVEQSCHQQ